MILESPRGASMEDKWLRIFVQNAMAEQVLLPEAGQVSH